MGLSLPVYPSKPKPRTAIDAEWTPCHKCPKAALYRENRGLHPENVLPVKMYYLAARQQRVGTMDGAYLQWTLNPADARAVLDEYSSSFPTALARQNCFEDMMHLDQIATKAQSEREEKIRERHRLAEKAKASRK